MKINGKLALLSLSVLMAFSLTACMNTKQARYMDDKTKTVLVDRSLLDYGGYDEALLRYANPKADYKKYTSVIIEPVMMFKPKNASKEEIADLKTLSSNCYGYLVRELGGDFKIVKDPAPGVLKIQVAILDAETSDPTMDMLSTVLPFGAAFSIAKTFVTGKPSAVGEISGEMKITDATTGEVLFAGADRRAGGKGMSGIFDSWHDANAGMEYWAKKTRYVLCKERGGEKCDKPSNF